MKTTLNKGGEMQAVVVTKQGRFVAYGYIPDGDLPHTPIITLLRCRMALSGPDETNGVWGIATNGPGPKVRVGPEVSEGVLFGVTTIVKVSPKAESLWQAIK